MTYKYPLLSLAHIVISSCYLLTNWMPVFCFTVNNIFKKPSSLHLLNEIQIVFLQNIQRKR